MTPPAPSATTPASTPGAQRLARTRLAILAYLQAGQRDAAGSQAQGHGSPADDEQASPWRGARDAGHRYWQAHPVRLAAGLVAPWLARWGQRHPLVYLALAAGIGAALVAARPWKLVSLTGLLVAALKSSNLASLALTALAATREHPRERNPQ